MINFLHAYATGLAFFFILHEYMLTYAKCKLVPLVIIEIFLVLFSNWKTTLTPAIASVITIIIFRKSWASSFSRDRGRYCATNNNWLINFVITKCSKKVATCSTWFWSTLLHIVTSNLTTLVWFCCFRCLFVLFLFNYLLSEIFRLYPIKW